MSCREFFGLFFGWNACKRVPIGYNVFSVLSSMLWVLVIPHPFGCTQGGL